MSNFDFRFYDFTSIEGLKQALDEAKLRSQIRKYALEEAFYYYNLALSEEKSIQDLIKVMERRKKE